jgi:Carboxypeptidase regulatory-like domain/TonB-dependent Receptor Plug Domain
MNIFERFGILPATQNVSTYKDLFGKYPGARSRCAIWVAKALLLSFATLLILLVAPELFAQTPGTGAIVGTVTDPSGALVAGAHVKVVNNGTDFSRDVVTTADGIFRCTLLPPGDYTLTIEASGFEKQSTPDIHVLVSNTTSIDLKLLLGTSTTTVEVAANVELADTQSSALGHTTNGDTIQALPLANRNFTQILALSPGVTVAVPDAGAFGKNTQNVMVNGAKTTANNFQFNGIDANNLSENSASGFAPEPGIAIPAPDTIAEFKVQTGMYDAGYGRSTGANIDIVSKQGTNEFHGSLWEFFRNDALNANNFFLNANGQPRPVLKQNQFGGTIGGPIRKDKTFFFGSYQGSRQINGEAQGALQTTILPPLTNDRSAAALGAIFGGQSGAFGGVAVAPNGSNINPVALALLNAKLPDGSFAIPTPQTILPGGVGESTYSFPGHYQEDQYSANLDQKLSDRNQLSGRFFHSNDKTNQPFTPFSATVPGWGTTFTSSNDMFTLSDAHTFSSNLTNLARFGYMRFTGLQTQANPVNASDIGMATPDGLPTLPGIQLTGLFTIGSFGEPFYFQNTNTFVWQDTVSLTRGRHSLRMGGEVKRHQLVLNVPFTTAGFLLIQSFPDFLLGQSAAQNGSSQSNIFQSSGSAGLFRKDERYFDAAGFVQDDFRATRRLTINAGLRYEFFGPPSETHGFLSSFNPATAVGQVPATGTFSGFTVPGNYKGNVPDGVTQTSGSSFWNPDYKDFAPRVGFALQLPGKKAFVLRGGYGIYYERLSGEMILLDVGQIPFSLTQSRIGSPNAAATLQDPFVPPLPPNSAFPIFFPRTPTSSLSVGAISDSNRSPYSQQYNLNLQYEFARNFLWQVGYVGSGTRHLDGCRQFNQAGIATPENPINGQTTTTNENLAQRVPFEGIAGGSYICETSFNAGYNALQTSVTKRTSFGLTLLASYTYSKTLDYTSGTGGIDSLELDFMSGDQDDRNQSKGPSDFDRTHRVVLSAVYQTPNLREGPAIAQKLLSHWQVSGVSVLQSGLPITPIDSTAGSVYGNLVGDTRAECTGANPASSGSLTSRLNGYFNLAAFAPAPTIGDGTGFGNCGVGILRGPSELNLDLGVQRSFAFTERHVLDFRAEFFNFTNTPKFGNPINDFAAGPGVFGLITSTVGNPRIIQFALKYRF